MWRILNHKYFTCPPGQEMKSVSSPLDSGLVLFRLWSIECKRNDMWLPRSGLKRPCNFLSHPLEPFLASCDKSLHRKGGPAISLIPAIPGESPVLWVRLSYAIQPQLSWQLVPFWPQDTPIPIYVYIRGKTRIIAYETFTLNFGVVWYVKIDN